MNHAAPALLIPDADLRLAEARLAAFEADSLGHDLDAVRQWAKVRRTDPAAPCPTPAALR